MKIVLWILQIVLGLMMMFTGMIKMIMPYEQLAGQMAWVQDLRPFMIRVIAFFELLGGIGLIIPTALRIKPFLTAWAAVGIGLIMTGAVATHIVRNEWGMTLLPFGLLLMAGIIAIGRFKIYPVHPRE
ncbi:DoxX family protein [bacterium]|nr:DoxX family protein [bacterium]